MPGVVPITSTRALCNATLPYVIELADLGVRPALEASEGLRAGLNVAGSAVTHRGVAAAHGLEFVDPSEILASLG
jgi:alanine dehydrogenase